ncbi:MAG TPA: hypothetical protein VFP65_19200 [Anaeromyxobacteraceae bacterium]|nr:hypothetical protein [Anaeromyxobacteraceae bacterium]
MERRRAGLPCGVPLGSYDAVRERRQDQQPGMNGWDVAGRLRAVDPSVAAYIVTGWGHEIAPDEPRRGTVAGVLAKPLDLDELERAITAKR